MIKRIDHIALAVRDLDRARAFFLEGLGGRQVWTADVEPMGFGWTTIDIGASCMLELVNPLGEDSFLTRFLAKRGDGAHHITFQVDDVEATQRRLTARGIPTFGLAEPFPGWKELYVHPKHAFGILLQFAEFDPLAWIDPDDEVPEAYRPLADAPTADTRIEVNRRGDEVEIRQGGQTLRLHASRLDELIESIEKHKD